MTRSSFQGVPCDREDRAMYRCSCGASGPLSTTTSLRCYPVTPSSSPSIHEIEAIHTPGHTPACMTYAIGDALFCGDALFMPDYGTGRCDFPNGSAHELYESVTGKLYELPDATRLFVGHDYLPGGRGLAFQTTIGESEKCNIRLQSTTSESEFVAQREARDLELSPPKLILQSLLVNIDAGRLPQPEDNGRRYFRIPMNLLGE